MRRACLVMVALVAPLAGCTLLGGYDFDGYHLGGSAGGSGGGGGHTCEDLDNDPENCGACGHSCLGGLCDKGACTVTQVFSNAEHEGNGKGVFGDLFIVPDADEGRSIVVVADIGDQGGMAELTGMVWRFREDGDGVIALAPPSMTEAVRVIYASSRVFWTSAEGRILSVSLGGGDMSTVLDGLPALRGLAFVPNTTIYVSVGGVEIDRFDTQTMNQDVPIPGQPNPNVLRTDGTLLFWTNLGTSPSFVDGSVMMFDGVTAEAIASAQLWPGGLAVDADPEGEIFWVTADGGVWEAAKKPGSEPKQLAAYEEPGDESPQNVTVDDEFVYWTSWGPCVNGAGCGGDPPVEMHGKVQRMRRDGTERVTLNSGKYLPTGIVNDARAVYWTTWFNGSVLKLAK